jgi:SAM-dependent methyltransferase
MRGLFGSEYADAYDHLYRDKDYVEECELIDRLLRTYGDGSVRSLLDLGCGTGNHALSLAERGYTVVGVDRSNAMLWSAEKKAASYHVDGKATFYEGDIRSFQMEHSFDASLMMFAVLGYQLENTDVLAALRTARKHMRLGGLFIFDVWYGPAVLREGPSDRVKSIQTKKGQILRLASGQLDVRHHLCKVSYHLWKLEGERFMGETEETHVMRYFFPLELNLFLECCGFAPIRLGSFPEFDRDPDETTWNVCGVARAV